MNKKTFSLVLLFATNIAFADTFEVLTCVQTENEAKAVLTFNLNYNESLVNTNSVLPNSTIKSEFIGTTDRVEFVSDVVSVISGANGIRKVRIKDRESAIETDVELEYSSDLKKAKIKSVISDDGEDMTENYSGAIANCVISKTN